MDNLNHFPVDALPEIIRNSVVEMHRNIQAPLPLVVSSALGAISLACQNSIDVRRPGGLVSPCSLYLITVAKSGERKTTVDNYFTQPIREVEAVENEKFQKYFEIYDADLIAWKVQRKVLLKRLEKKLSNNLDGEQLKLQLVKHASIKPQEPREFKLLYSDATPSAIKFGLHTKSSSIGFISSEAGGVFNGRAVEDLALFNDGWGGIQIEVERRNSECFVVPNPRITLSLMIQPEVMTKYLGRHGAEARGIGFFSRCLFASPISTQGMRFIDAQRASSWQHLFVFQVRLKEILAKNIDDVKTGMFSRQIIQLSPSAQARWIEAYNEIESYMHPGAYFSDVNDCASKFAENLARVAALLHYFEGKNGDITLETLSRAIEICRWYLVEFKRLFGLESKIPVEVRNAFDLEAWLRNFVWHRGEQRIQKNLIRQYAPNKLRNKMQLDSALNLLALHGKIIMGRIGKTNFVELNPNYFGQPATPKLFDI